MRNLIAQLKASSCRVRSRHRPFWCVGCTLQNHGGSAAGQRGFTLVELIMTMVILGIIAAVAAPRFFSTNVFQSRGFADQVQTTLRYAQKIAIAQRITVCVRVSATGVALLTDGCVAPLNVLASQRCVTDAIDHQDMICAPAGVTITAGLGDWNFDALGRTATYTITVSGATNNIVVENETGYVHSP